ncbi:MAG: leucyl/phenylalanyl-tRNA--protein transferase [Bacteroidales bacterium]|nr:leucyl/phenylalanyl-tRNA--protein transferase [Bacteroidales bacterium]
MAPKYIFPDPAQADEEGLLAAGGDLSVETLLTAYSQGIFPWFDENSPILWWCPDPRMVLFPAKLKISDSLKQKIRSGKYDFRIDADFDAVIRNCAVVKRRDQDATWITNDMLDAYRTLHKEGYAHSFETYYDNELIGGLYGVSLGGTFFGESMFHRKPDASKISLYYLVMLLKYFNFDMIDAQQPTSHLKSMGAEEVSRAKFLEILSVSMKSPTRRGNWNTFTELLRYEENKKRDFGYE